MTHGSLFSGIGGFDLVAEWMGWNNIFHCEWNKFGQRALKYYWPNAKSYGDITTTDFIPYREKLDVLTGGFPCQPFSTAGQRQGIEDGRYLWPEMLRAIRESQPLAVVGENVTGLLSMEQYEMFARVESRSIVRFENYDHYEAVYTRQATLLVNDICENLEKEGYDVQPFVIPAAGIGAPHRRDRIWFVAYSGDLQRNEKRKKRQQRRTRREAFGKPKRNDGEKPSSNTSGKGLPIGIQPGIGEITGTNKALQGSEFTRTFTEKPGWEKFPTQSPVCNRNDGFPGELAGITFSNWRTESIKGMGNAIVPQVAYQIFKAIEQYNESNP